MSGEHESTSRGEASGDGELQKSSPTLYKMDWYQTETTVVINLLSKNLLADKVDVKFSEDELDFTLAFKDGESVHKVLSLEHSVVVERCSSKVLPTKVEIKLTKWDGYHWTNLEKVQSRPSALSSLKNWDKVVSEMDGDEQEGDAVVNALFQKIYAEGSDEVKKAMNKSFIESGGTELNTNWDAVSKGKVSIKPPEGMEWKPWDSQN